MHCPSFLQENIANKTKKLLSVMLKKLILAFILHLCLHVLFLCLMTPHQTKEGLSFLWPAPSYNCYNILCTQRMYVSACSLAVTESVYHVTLRNVYGTVARTVQSSQAFWITKYFALV